MTKKKKKLFGVAKRGNEFLNSSIDNHQRRLTEAIRELEKNIINQVKEFKTSDGVLLGPKVNLKQAKEVHVRLKGLFDETYGSAARDVVKGFSKAARYIQDEFDDLGIAAEFTSVDRDMIETLKRSTWGTFNQFGLQTQEQLVDKMYGAVLGKTSFSNLVTDFQGILSGHRDVRGRPMSIYANLYANDAIMNFHNSVHMKKAADAGMKYFLYYGNLMSTSRDFCIQRVGKVYAKEVIDSWEFNWQGKSGPAFTNRGGYNCRHRWVATRLDWVDDDVPIIYDIEKDRKTAGVAAELKPSEKLPAEIRAKMSQRQITALDNYVPSDKESRTIAELQERKLAEGLGADHIIGKRPFDLFLDNEFVETKTFVSGRGQIRMRPASRGKKTDFIKRYKVRGHTVAVDMRPNSDTYGKMFYRKGLGDFKVQNMYQVKDYEELKQLLKKGSKKMPELTTAYRSNVPTAKTIKQAESYAVKSMKVAKVDYDEISTRSADLLNRYIGGCIDELKIKPTAIVFDDSYFLKGASKRYAAIAMEDGTLYLNRNIFKTIENVKRVSSEQFLTGHFSTSAEGHVLRHEMGHLKYFRMGGTEASASRKLTKTMIDDLKQIGPENLSQYVSTYAKMNQGEFYAEMMAKRLNGERLHPVVQKIMNDIESGLKRMKAVPKVAGEGVAAELKKLSESEVRKLTPTKIVKEYSKIYENKLGIEFSQYDFKSRVTDKILLNSQIERTISTVSELFDRYPKLKNKAKIKYLIFKNTDIYTIINHGVSSNALAMSYDPFDQIGFANQMFAESSSGISIGGFTAARGYANTICHEIGHQFGYKTGAYERFRKIYDSKSKEWLKSNISIYGATNYKEGFAEIFSIFTHKDYKKGMLSKVLEEFIAKELL